MKKVLAGIGAVALMLGLAACSSDAHTASYNLSKDADDFKVNRKITFINGITNDIMLTVEGFCSINADGEDGQLEVTCKEGPDAYTKDFLGLSDNVTYIVEQVESKDVSLYHRKIFVKPESILPDIDVQTGEQ
jgi:hypothetical protein